MGTWSSETIAVKDLNEGDLVWIDGTWRRIDSIEHDVDRSARVLFEGAAEPRQFSNLMTIDRETHKW